MVNEAIVLAEYAVCVDMYVFTNTMWKEKSPGVNRVCVNMLVAFGNR